MRALITGITGQDGYYLARHLLAGGDTVLAGVRPVERGGLADLLEPELAGVELIPCELEDLALVEALVERTRPEVVYHLAAQSSVGLSWKEPVMTARVNALGTVYLLDALRRYAPEARFIAAGSCDCFDHEAARDTGITPESPLKATNPYAASKVMGQQLTQCYRREYGLHAAVAVLFNHTSPRRSEIYVERGIVRQAVRISLGLAETVTIGSWETRRDWSWAPDLMEALALMGRQTEPVDLVLASGHTMIVGDWVHEAFGQLGLEQERHLRVDAGRLHRGDRPHTFGNIEPACERLGWRPKTGLAEMVRRLIEFDREALLGEVAEQTR